MSTPSQKSHTHKRYMLTVTDKDKEVWMKLPFHLTDNGGFGFCCDDDLANFKIPVDGSDVPDLDWLVFFKTEQYGADMKIGVTLKDPVGDKVSEADQALALPSNAKGSSTGKQMLTFPDVHMKTGAYAKLDENTAEIIFKEEAKCTSGGPSKREIKKSLRDLAGYMLKYQSK